MKALTNLEYEKLNWEGVFKNFNLIRIRTEADGSCFFHSLAKAYFKPYIIGKIGDATFNRKEFIKNLRKDLAITLGTKINPENPGSKTYYQTLSNGELEKSSEAIPSYSLENMQKALKTFTKPVSNIYNEFISNQLDIDIYILDGKKKDVYMTGTDDNLLYKNRKSVVILYIQGSKGNPGHYELVGSMQKNTNIETCFAPDSALVLAIRKRMNRLRKM
jgi:hypothetical protein